MKLKQAKRTLVHIKNLHTTNTETMFSAASTAQIIRAINDFLSICIVFIDKVVFLSADSVQKKIWKTENNSVYLDMDN